MSSVPSEEQLAELIARAESNQNHDLRKALDRALRRLADQTEHQERLEVAVREAAAGAFAYMDIPPVPPPPKDKRRKMAEEVAVPWIADLQLGKRTPDYDSEVAAARMELWAEKVIELTEIQRAARPIRKAHVWIMGDIVEGEDIFPGQTWLIDSSLYRQITTGVEILTRFLRSMLGTFDSVHVTSVIGNHGRIGRKGQAHPETNMDRLCYQIAAGNFEDEPRLSWTFAEPHNDGDRGWHSVDRIGAYSCLLVHGDQFRGSLGVPWYGIRKKVLGWKAMAAADTLPFPDFQDVAFGHWHQPVTWTINGIGVRGCGSPESYNDFAAENLAGMSRPSQRLMFVSPSKGIVTAEHPEVWLD